MTDKHREPAAEGAGSQSTGSDLSRRTVVSGSIAAAVALPAMARAETNGDVQAPLQAAEAGTASGRLIPSRILPVPDTVSPVLQERIAAPYPVNWNQIPGTAAEWRALAAQSALDVAPFVSGIKESFKLDVERTAIGGIDVFVITPDEIPKRNRDRLLLHVHGGGYVLYPGEAGAGEGMLMAGHGGFKVISVDYRMAPDHPHPAALDDAMAVWRALLDEHDPRGMAIFGSSAGGTLTLAMVLRARAEGLALPAAIAPSTPVADLTGAGDSRAANEYIDNVLVSGLGWARAATTLYAGGGNLRDPYLSPIYADFSGYPPSILTTGTRDLFLSDTVRVHRRLRQAGVEAVLQVFEGQSHAQFLDPTIPEAKEAFDEIAAFFDRHLA